MRRIASERFKISNFSGFNYVQLASVSFAQENFPNNITPQDTVATNTHTEKIGSLIQCTFNFIAM